MLPTGTEQGCSAPHRAASIAGGTLEGSGGTLGCGTLSSMGRVGGEARITAVLGQHHASGGAGDGGCG